MIYYAKNSPEETELEKINRIVALRAAEEGMVLLENDGILPFSREVKKIALFGNGARKTVKGGTGSGDVNERSFVTVEAGLRNAGYEIVTSDWLERYDTCWAEDRKQWKKQLEEIAQRRQVPFVIAYLETLHLLPTLAVSGEDLMQADVALYVIARRSGEGIDRVAEKGDYQLYDEEYEALQLLKETYKRVIVVINAGGPIEINRIKEEIKPSALIIMSQPGMEGGTALAHMLTGKITPSGKLTDTWAKQYLDYPEAEHFSGYSENPHEIFYREGIYVGYRYFQTVGKEVAYPFGYGRSYTTFKVTCEGGAIEEGKLVCRCKVQNTGNFAGKEVVQVYGKAPAGRLSKPERVLVGFCKTGLLAPGEEASCVVACDLSVLSSYEEVMARELLEAGNYGFYVGTSIEAARPAVLVTWGKEQILHSFQNRLVCQRTYTEWNLTRVEKEEDFPYRLELSEAQSQKLLDVLAADEKMQKLPELEDTYIKGLSDEQLIGMVVGAAREDKRSTVGNAAESVPGAAGETSYGIPGLASLVLADGGSGLRLFHHFQTDSEGNVLEMDGMAGLERGAFAEDISQAQVDAIDYYQYCTAFPIGTMLAQTWNEELCQEVGRAVGKEMEVFGVQVWLAPSINIHRNPLCGRNFEYYSEDPLVTGYLAAAVCRGVAENSKATVTIKHFAANNQELYRHSSDSIVSERALREIYLKPFEILVKRAQPLAIMTSYNCINGVQAANSYDLCTGIAREEWGFDGLIMTDWGTTDPGASDPVECIQCGNDLIMPGGERDKERLRSAMQEGRLTRAELENAAEHIIKVVKKLKES